MLVSHIDIDDVFFYHLLHMRLTAECLYFRVYMDVRVSCCSWNHQLQVFHLLVWEFCSQGKE